MNRFLRSVAALSVCLALVGCEKKASVTTEKTVKGPGGTTTTIDQKTIKQTGEDPPPASGTQPVVPNDGK
jgi:hypothetical protein